MMTSLYTGITGMKAYGEGMSSVANNLANMNTVGFKSAMMLYQDLTSQDLFSTSSYYDNTPPAVSQVGMGVSVLTNRTMFFQQGSFESGSEPTDMGISGMGFFGVTNGSKTEYTRAGNFRFTKEGALVDPQGFTLLGNKITNGVTAGTAAPIQLNLSPTGQSYMPPRATSGITLVDNLGSVTSLTTNAANPFFSLAAAWNGTATPPLSTSQFSQVTTVPVHDSEGTQQNLNTYYDFVGTFDGKKVYEFVVGTDPAVDGSAAKGTAGAGLLAAGTLTFAFTGELLDMTMFQAPAGGNTSDLSAWLPASFGADGSPALSVTFAGTQGAALPAQAITMNMGLNLNGTWSNNFASAAAVGANPSGLYTGAGRERASSSSTAYTGSSANIFQKQDGYAQGYLTEITINGDGIMAGKYSNNQSMDLYRIPLYRFTSQDGLHLEGGNHYSATTESGPAEAGFAQTENFGSIAEKSLEQSTVDMAREFSTMILTQRGFQMNSKVVTTSDQMLQKALELKR